MVKAAPWVNLAVTAGNFFAVRIASHLEIRAHNKMIKTLDL